MTRSWCVVVLLLAAAFGRPTAHAQAAPPEETPETRPDGARPATEGADPVHSSHTTNRLIGETSPYLLQHAHNPVDWYPWGADALAAAKKLDRPIFLSIGYSACHWCHVMAHESFEDAEVAAILNQNFICIKVDREERPDLDEIYMSAVQMMTGSGGWPMSVFLTPDLKPFYGGTYFPPEDRWGRPGFRTLLNELIRAWKDRRADINKSGDNLVEAIRSAAGIQGESGDPEQSVIDAACRTLLHQFDPRHGGFGGAPKFPPSMELNLLLRRYRATGDRAPANAVETTLDRMSRGGMYDQIGGGFCRYSTDERWLVPHFEKMLYDNALLVRTYLWAYQAFRRPEFARVARESLEYVLRDMGRPGGGFYSSEDADSEGVEGKFYVWTRAEVMSVLGPESGPLFCDYFDITETGNWEEHNIPNIPLTLEDFALRHKIDATILQTRLDESRARLLAVRSHRVRPGLDNKVLTSWNALMVQTMILGSQVLGERKYLDAAVRTVEFLLRDMQKDGRLLVTSKDGEAKLNGYLDDYAFLTAALIDLYEATFDVRWMDEALRLNRSTLDHFWDEADGAFFFTSHDHETLIARTKAPTDGVIPSGNSEAARNLLRLSELTGDDTYRRRAERILRRFHGSMAASGRAFANMLSVLDRYLSSPREIVLVGRPEEISGFLDVVHSIYLPHRVLTGFDPAAEGAAGLQARLPLLAGRGRVDGRSAAYVCQDGTCRRPVTSPEELRQMLER